MRAVIGSVFALYFMYNTHTYICIIKSIFLVAMRDLAIRSADAFILVYAVDDKNSYEEIIRLKDLIFELRGENVPPVVVVANKTGKSIQTKKIHIDLTILLLRSG